MASTLVQNMPPFDHDANVGVSVAPKWKVCLEDFEMFLVANRITDTTRKRALLLYQAGPCVHEIFRQIPNTGDAAAYKTTVDKLTEHFEPQRNRLYEIYKFRTTNQQANETIDQFHTRLHSLAQSCEFAADQIDFEIMLQIVTGGTSSWLRKLALRDPKLTLADLLLAGRRAEMSTYQAAEMEQRMDNVHAVKAQSFKHNSHTKAAKCRNCGGPFPHKDKPCSAHGQTCHNCGKLNHFAKYCRGKTKTDTVPHQRSTNQSRVRPIRNDKGDNSDTSDSDYCYVVSGPETPQPAATVTIHDCECHVLINTGTTINIIDGDTFSRIKGVDLKQTKVQAYAYNSNTPMKMQGKFNALVETKQRYAVATFYITKDNGGCLLSYSTAKALGLISLHVNTVSHTGPSVHDHRVNEILDKFPPVFKGLGKLKDKQVELVIDPDVKPVAQQQRRIPFHLHTKVQNKLAKLVAQEISEKVPENEETDWVSPIVCVPKKNGEIRLCINMRAANKAIKRVRHIIPTVKDISIDLRGATVFSKLDLSQAYHQLELSSKSRHITTFTTHMGLFRYKRLNY